MAVAIIAVLLTSLWMWSVAECDKSIQDECPLRDGCPWRREEGCGCAWDRG